MKTNYSDAQIESLIRKHYPDAYEIRMLSGGLVSQTFLFKSEGKKFIFQVGGAKEAYEKEQYVSEQYQDALPVRVVRGVYENTDGRAYCFSDYIEGCRLFDLSRQELAQMVPSVIALLEKISSHKIPEHLGYGRFGASGQARFASWQAFISSVYDDDLFNWRRPEATRLDFDAIQNAIAVLRTNRDALRIEKASLLHGDMGSYNLLVDGTQMSGVIDWDLSLYGDPLYELANVLFWNEDKLQPLVDAIKAKYMADEANRKKLHCYAIHMGLEEIYRTVVLGEIGYDDSWVMNRLREVTAAL